MYFLKRPMPEDNARNSHQPKTLYAGSLLAIVLVLVPLLWLAGRKPERPPDIHRGGVHGIYRTGFVNEENPLFERGVWANGQTTALDWANVRTAHGLAFGTDSGRVRFSDSTALLTGAWGPDQTAEARVYTVNQSDTAFEEVELRLRSSLSGHRATGYEINFRCSKTRNAYTQIVRWNGPLGKFAYLNSATGPQYGVSNGDIVRATIVGQVITAYINGVQVLQATDDTYSGGSPGIGFYLEGASGINNNFGFTSFMATDMPVDEASTVKESEKGRINLRM